MVYAGTEPQHNRHRLLFLIDEFPSLNRMEIFADALSYMAGYGLKAYLITQDIRQIVDAYGNNESIVSNCHVRIAFAPNQYETAKLHQRHDRHHHRAEGHLQLQRPAPVAGDGTPQCLRRQHVQRPLIDPGRSAASEAAQEKRDREFRSASWRPDRCSSS